MLCCAVLSYVLNICNAQLNRMNAFFLKPRRMFSFGLFCLNVSACVWPFFLHINECDRDREIEREFNLCYVVYTSTYCTIHIMPYAAGRCIIKKTKVIVLLV